MPDAKHEITIAAPAEAIVKAITTPEGLKSWWTADVEAEAKVGSVAKFGFMKRAVVFTMQVEKINPEAVEWTCTDGPDEWIGTKQKFAMKAGEEKGTILLRFVHAGWKSDAGGFARCNTTWGHLMVLLKDYVEGKKPGPYFR